MSLKYSMIQIEALTMHQEPEGSVQPRGRRQDGENPLEVGT